MKRSRNPDKLSVDVFSRKMLELTITSQTIALALKAAQFMQQDEDMLTKPRGIDAPYRLRNQTGFGLHVWAVTNTLLDQNPMAAKLEDGEEIPWRFEEWGKMREVCLSSILAKHRAILIIAESNAGRVKRGRRPSNRGHSVRKHKANSRNQGGREFVCLEACQGTCQSSFVM